MPLLVMVMFSTFTDNNGDNEEDKRGNYDRFCGVDNKQPVYYDLLAPVGLNVIMREFVFMRYHQGFLEKVKKIC